MSDLKNCAVVLNNTSGSLQCQFSHEFRADYEHEGKDFCILHLPINYEDHNQPKNNDQPKREAFQKILKNGRSSYSFEFVKLPNIEIVLNFRIPQNFDSLTFIESDIFSLRITGSGKENRELNNLTFINTRLRSQLIIENIKIKERLHFTESKAYNLFIIKNCSVDKLLINKSEFSSRYFAKNYEYINYGIYIENVKCSELIFHENTTDLMLYILSSEFNEINLRSNFFIPPKLFSDDFFDNAKIVELPRKKDISLKKFDENFRIFKTDVLKLIWLQANKYFFYLAHKPRKKIETEIQELKKQIKFKESITQIEYKNLRQLYNIAKSRNHLEEMGDFFSLAQSVSENNKLLSPMNCFASRIYGLISNYGQSISKPISWLLAIWFAFGTIFYLLDAKVQSKKYLFSLQQIIKPYSLFFSSPDCSHYTWYTYFLGFLESSFSIALLASLVVAIRWHLRKSHAD